MISVVVPSPVTSLSVSNVSTTGITVNWTIPSSDNYVTYYTISYTPSCPELSSVNETVSVVPHQSTTTYSYTLIGLYSGMNYTITVRAGNVLGGSDPSSVNEDTLSIGMMTILIYIILFCVQFLLVFLIFCCYYNQLIISLGMRSIVLSVMV